MNSRAIGMVRPMLFSYPVVVGRVRKIVCFCASVYGRRFVTVVVLHEHVCMVAIEVLWHPNSFTAEIPTIFVGIYVTKCYTSLS